MTTVTLALAIYGALISSALAALRVYELWKAQRVIEIRHAFTYSDVAAHYNFMISNVSSGNVTIIECMVEGLSPNAYGKLKPSWGVSPNILPHRWADHNRESKPFNKPFVLKSGDALYVSVNSLDLVRYSKINSEISLIADSVVECQPTKDMQLSIEHSRSKRRVTSRFTLEKKEHDPLTYETMKTTHRLLSEKVSQVCRSKRSPDGA